jgi:Cu2+-containing amine oxidase
VSAAEGGKFQKVMQEMDKLLKSVTKDEVKKTIEILSKEKKLQKVLMFGQAKQKAAKPKE